MCSRKSRILVVLLLVVSATLFVSGAFNFEAAYRIQHCIQQ